MKKTTAISGVQLICLLLVGRLFITMTYSPAGNENTLITILGGLFSNALQALLLIFPLLLIRKFPDKNVVEVGYDAAAPIGAILSVLYAAFLLWVSIKLMCDFSEFITVAFPIFSAKKLIVLFMALTALYISTLGAEPIARSSAVAAALFIVMLILVLLGTSGELDIHNLNISVEDPMGDILSSAADTFGRNAELVTACLLLPYLRSGYGKTVYSYIAIKYAAVAAIAVLFTAILGNFTYSSPLPFFHLSSYSDSAVIARFDALFLITWTLFAVIKLGICIFLAGRCLSYISPKTRPAYANCVITALALICVLFIIRYSDIRSLENSKLCAAALILLAAVIPALALLVPNGKNSKSGKKDKKEKTLQKEADENENS